MLNPAFKLLDPEQESLERLGSLSKNQVGLSALTALNNNHVKSLQQRLKTDDSLSGVIKQQQLWSLLRETHPDVKQELNIYQWPCAILEPMIKNISSPTVLLLGLLDGEGMWASAVAGVSQGGLDYLSTFQWLWQDAPELVTQQTLDGFEHYCQIAEKKLARPAVGLFIYHDEFRQWQEELFSFECLQRFVHAQTARYKWL